MKQFRALALLMFVASPFLLAFRLFTQVVGIPEPWSTLLFAFVVPIVVQLIGKVAPSATKIVYELASLGLTIVFVLVSGGFAGLAIPVYADDLGNYIGSWVALLLAAWGTIEVSYRKVLGGVIGSKTSKGLFGLVGLTKPASYDAK